MKRHFVTILLVILFMWLLSLRPSAGPLPLLPNPKLTPGQTVSVTVKQICTPGYSKSVRNVPQSKKRQVFELYGFKQSGLFEVDHLVSLELGGSNDVTNLWPQSYVTRPYNAKEKDKLENRLHWMVCHGQLALSTAQHVVATDWIDGYQRYVANKPRK